MKCVKTLTVQILKRVITTKLNSWNQVSRYYSSVFDVIAKHKEILREKKKEPNFKEEIKLINEDEKGSRVKKHITTPIRKEPILSIETERMNHKEWTNETAKEVLKKTKETNDKTVQTVKQVYNDEETEITNVSKASNNSFYDHKSYILKFIQHLGEHEDIQKYRYITKHVIRNITKFNDKEILFILKMFAQKKYKNLLLLQCTSEYFYWLCKMNFHSLRNISYYLYFCSLLNYIPTMKYVEEYLKVITTYKEKEELKNSFFLNMLEEETNEHPKDIKYLIHILYFLHKANIKNDLFEILLHMCCYYASDLTLKGTFLLLKVLIQAKQDQCKVDALTHIQKNIERHIDIIKEQDFNEYLYILLHHLVILDNTFFVFIKNYMEKKEQLLSSQSIMLIMKLIKKENHRDPVILKKILNHIIKHFFNYTYAELLYTVDVLTFFKYFDESFFNFLFSTYVCTVEFNEDRSQLVKENKLNVNLPTWETKSSTFKTNSSPYTKSKKQKNHNKEMKEENENDRYTYNTKNNKKEDIKGKNNENKKMQMESTNKQIYKSDYSIEGDVSKNKIINELTHLPLHLHINESTVKLDSSNIIYQNKEKRKEETKKHMQINIKDPSYNLQYIEMYIHLFIYMGINGIRSWYRLQELSNRIITYLKQKLSYNSYKKKRTLIKEMKETFVGINQIITSIKGKNDLKLEFKQRNLLQRNQALHLSKDEDENKKNEIKKISKKDLINNAQPNQIMKEKINQTNFWNSKESKKGCLKFSYDVNEKLNMEHLKRKKELLINSKHNLTEGTVYNLRFSNVETFRKLKNKKLQEDNINDHTVVIKEQNKDDDLKKNKNNRKKNNVVHRIFNSWHPAFIRLHNRTLFQKHFQNMYKSEKYCETIKRNHRGKQNKETPNRKQLELDNESNDRRLRIYKQIRNLRNKCLKRYNKIFTNNTSSLINYYINKTHEKEMSEEKHSLIDRIGNTTEIHIDNCLLVSLDSKESRRISRSNGNNLVAVLKKHKNFINRSNQITSEEFLGKRISMKETNSYNCVETNRNDLIKWIYRYMNNCKLFMNVNTYEPIMDEDIQKLKKEINQYTDTTGPRNKLKISVKNIVLLADSCHNIYYRNNYLIDVLMYHVFTSVQSFYNNCTENIKGGNCFLYSLVVAWKFLIVTMQINQLTRSILTIDNRYKTISNFVQIFLYPYFIFHFVKVHGLLDNIRKQKEGNQLAFTNQFFVTFWNIAIVMDHFFIFHKVLFLLMKNLYKKETIFQTILPQMYSYVYHASVLFLIHAKISISKQSNSIDIVNKENRMNDKMIGTYLTCISFFILLSRMNQQINTNKWKEIKHFEGEQYSMGTIDEYTEPGHYDNIKHGFFEKGKTHNEKHINGNIVDINIILSIFLKYIKVIKNKMVGCDKYSTTHKNILYSTMQFFYIFKKVVRHKVIKDIDEKQYDEIFPYFVIRELEKNKKYSILFKDLFYYDQDMHMERCNTSDDSLLYHYFSNFFLKK